MLKPNDRYLLNELRFRLYYTSQSADASQTIDPFILRINSGGNFAEVEL